MEALHDVIGLLSTDRAERVRAMLADSDDAAAEHLGGRRCRQCPKAAEALRDRAEWWRMP